MARVVVVLTFHRDVIRAEQRSKGKTQLVHVTKLANLLLNTIRVQETAMMVRQLESIHVQKGNTGRSTGNGFIRCRCMMDG